MSDSVFLPSKPTDAMLTAAAEAVKAGGNFPASMESAWAAMIAAAPPPSGPGDSKLALLRRAEWIQLVGGLFHGFAAHMPLEEAIPTTCHLADRLQTEADKRFPKAVPK